MVSDEQKVPPKAEYKTYHTIWQAVCDAITRLLHRIAQLESPHQERFLSLISANAVLFLEKTETQAH